MHTVSMIIGFTESFVVRFAVRTDWFRTVLETAGNRFSNATAVMTSRMLAAVLMTIERQSAAKSAKNLPFSVDGSVSEPDHAYVVIHDPNLCKQSV